MKDRIFEVMRMVGKNPTDFANTIEISPAVLSSIKSGRTKPTLFLIEKIKSVYPNINMNWLMTGEGEMFTDGEKQTETTSNDKTGNLAENTSVKQTETYKQKEPETHKQKQPEIETAKELELPGMFNEPETAMRVENKHVKENESWQVKTIIKPDGRKISQIIVLYNDGTFETLTNKE